MDKKCIYCNHLQHSYEEYDEMGGYDVLSCRKKNFSENVSIQFLRELDKRADSCADFEEES